MYSPIEKSLRVMLKLHYNESEAAELFAELDEDYDSVIPTVTWNHAVVLIVAWARRNGRTADMVRAAHKQKPKVVAVRRLAADLERYEQTEKTASEAGLLLYCLRGHGLQIQPPQLDANGETSAVVAGRGVRLVSFSGV